MFIGKEDFMNLCFSLIVYLDKEECKSDIELYIYKEEVEGRFLGLILLNGREVINCYICNIIFGDVILGRGKIINFFC